MKQWQIIAAGLLITIFSAVGGYTLHQSLTLKDKTATNKIEKPRTVGTLVDDFSLRDVDGNRRNFSEWKGKVVAINFWATWCPPCREEIPHFVELQHAYLDDGLQFVGIALQPADEVRGFLEEFKVNYPALVGGTEVINLAGKLGNDIGALPYTVIIDRDGKVAFTRRGPISKMDAESVIKRFL